MMSDRFSGQLRRHLLETADERPPDGLLEVVMRDAAATRQRQPWVARVRWRLDPIAPLKSARLRVGLVTVALLIVLAMLVVLAAGGGLGRHTVFEGRWTSTDSADRSTRTLVIESGRSPNVHFVDDFSIDCQRRGDTSTVYVADGQAQILGSRLIAHYASAGCETRLAPYDASYDYDASTDTILDDENVQWVRQ